MSVCDTNEPMIAGQPGRTSCTRVSAASDSAVCCASAAGTDTGPMAPIRMNGVTITICPALAISNSDSSMRMS